MSRVKAVPLIKNVTNMLNFCIFIIRNNYFFSMPEIMLEIIMYSFKNYGILLIIAC
jgi:hypothetical protein